MRHPTTVGQVVSPKGPDWSKNLLFFGDNYEVMRKFLPPESVDLVYLDPPFNSNRNYNVLFQHKSSEEPNAQITAFGDMWTWSVDDEVMLRRLQAEAPTQVADAITAMYQLIGASDMLSYLVMMTARLVELRRVLKPNGSLYLHCDPAASHYLKVILDAIFGPTNFVTEISWKRANAHNDSKRWGSVRDVIFYYAKGKQRIWNTLYGPYDPEYVASEYNKDDGDGRGPWRRGDLTAAKPGGDVSYDWRVKQSPKGVWSADLTDEYLTQTSGWTYRAARPYTGRFWAYSKANMIEFEQSGKIRYTREGNPEYKRHLADMPGAPISNNWTDIPAINSGAAERLGYPTQKPVALMERIISASSNPGDVVLDPFCGCGTTVDAAQRLGRRWIGIDVSYLAVDLIKTRMIGSYGSQITESFQIIGAPADVDGARAMFADSPFEFERWAVTRVDGTPNEKQVGDRGVDGVIRFPLDKRAQGRVLVSVKGGKSLNPAMVRDLAGTVESQRDAFMGILITIETPTRGMIEACGLGGSYTHPLTGQVYPKLQIITVSDLLNGKRPAMPTPIMPYLQSERLVSEAPSLF